MTRVARRAACVLALALAGAAGTVDAARPATPARQDEPRAWQAFELEALARERAESGRAYLPFLERASLSAGLYELAAGARDLQQPHERDEVYHVLAGRALLRVGSEDVPVRPGSVIHVAAGVEHRFHAIEDDLSVLVLFAGAPTAK